MASPRRRRTLRGGIVLALLAAWALVPWSLGRVLATALLFWVLPGLGWLRVLPGVDKLRRSERWLLALPLFAAIVSFAGLIAHFGGAPPRVAWLASVAVGLLVFVLRGGGEASSVRSASAWIAGGLGILLLMWFSPPQLSLSSDVYAHVAAMRATLEEKRVFPEHEFYPVGQGTGADPRFGTLHAAYAQLAISAGLAPLRGWHLASGLGLLIFVCGAQLLGRAWLPSRRLALMATLLALASYGGAYYNLFRIAAFPLWVGMGMLFAATASMWDLPEQRRARTWIVAILVGALPLVHALAGIFAILVLVAMLLVSARRAAMLPVLLRVMSVLLVTFVLRFLIAYGDVNPIHHRPWELMRWGALGVSARPTYVLQWLGLPGMVALLVGLLRGRRLWGDEPMRWAMLLGAGAIAIVSLPPLLEPLMKLLGFLPMRGVMLVLFPWFLVAAFARQLQGRRVGAVALVVCALAVSLRFGGRWEGQEGEALILGPAFAGIVEQITSDAQEGEVVVLSDPFTMLALRAMSPCAIVAVPDGRSSPRDADAEIRLRDSWAALSPFADASTLEEIAAKYGVTHVVWNGAFARDLYSYEYPVVAADLPRMRARLDSIDDLELLTGTEQLAIYRRRGKITGEPVAHSSSCPQTPADPSASREALHDDFYVRALRAELVEELGEISLRVEGFLGYEGAAPIPDRRLIVRADRVPGPVPDWLAAFEKPLRKLIERGRRERYRARWDVLPAGGSCPTWVLEPGRELPLRLRLPVPAALAAGEYAVTIQVSEFSVFTLPDLRDFLKDDDLYSGPVAGSISVGRPEAHGAR